MELLVVQRKLIINPIIVNDQNFFYESEESMLDDLIVLDDYFNKIKERVELDHLPDTNWTLGDVYTDVSIIPEGSQQNDPSSFEQYIFEWLESPEQKQIALLGEYGQGKSSASLMLTYRMIMQKHHRIPILLELRGRSPSTLQSHELLAAWGVDYGISGQALMKLLQSGRLLLILEGFDEMAEASSSEARMNHFASLWQFCYPRSKIIFTGRPNFFLDDKELRQSMGIAQSVAAGPYTQALTLQPFHFDQMTKAMRKADPDDGNAIITLAKSDATFRDVVSRPSLLYLVCVLWRSSELQKIRNSLTSASVIGLFINHLYRRQEEKARNRRHGFMELSLEERAYFQDGVAAFMAVNLLKNHI
ncbi:MAG: hypothetical protein HQL94_11645, partial [Magnetococcales bacterium]|nr:hypothetical protein [Magnetococcales bacterium]